MFRAMPDGRKRRAAKQARRDARRSEARQGRPAETESPEDTPLIDEVRAALDDGQPIDVLGLVSMLILATSSRPVFRPQAEDEPPPLDDLITAFIGVPGRETTALLAVLGELLVDDDDDARRDRCRTEVRQRDDELPRWLTGLAQTGVHRVVRMAHVLGDGEELLLGVRLADGQHLTCAATVDRLDTLEVVDAFVISAPIDGVVGVAEASNSDPDTTFVDVDVADARAGLQKALDNPLAALQLTESDTWPGCRALVRWLVQLMPPGGSDDVHVHHDSPLGVLDRFFASPPGRPFDAVDHRELLGVCLDAGTGDPVRWSAARLRLLLNSALPYDGAIPVEPQLDVPDLLRAFVPFAHAESGIRDELTADAVAAIDEMADHYRATVLEEARSYDDDEDDDGTG